VGVTRSTEHVAVVGEKPEGLLNGVGPSCSDVPSSDFKGDVGGMRDGDFAEPRESEEHPIPCLGRPAFLLDSVFLESESHYQNLERSGLGCQCDMRDTVIDVESAIGLFEKLQGGLYEIVGNQVLAECDGEVGEC
jgi:hypothetical protein